MMHLLRRRRAASLVAGIAVAAVALTACGGGGGSTTSSTAALKDKILTISSTFAPVSMDPAKSGNGRAGTMLQPAYEPLVRTAADGTLSPGLATAWKVADDNKSVKFTLRANAKFSDGEPVNAAAAKKSIEYWVATKGPFSVNLSSLDSVTVNSDTEFTVTVKQPNPDLATIFNTYWLAGDLISPKAIDTPDKLATDTFGAGPYVLDSATTITGKTYNYTPNKNYYDQTAIKWDKVVISVYEDQNSAIQAFKTGQLKVMISDPITGNANKNNLPAGASIVAEPVQWTGLVISDRTGAVNKPLGDVRVRQAINFALDRKTITSALFGDFGTPTSQLQLPGFVGYDEANDAKYRFDPDKAKQLLTDAGYGSGITIDVGYVNNTLNSTQATAIAGQLAKVGITLKLTEFQNFGDQNTQMAQKKVGAIIQQSNSGAPFMAKFQTLDANGSLNYYHDDDPELTALIAAAAAKPAGTADADWKAVQAKVTDLAWFGVVSGLKVTYFVAAGVSTPKIGQSLIIDMTQVVPAA